jgi:flagellar protein FlaG
MADILDAVTAAPAPTPPPSGARAQQGATSLPPVAAGGNGATASGESLPPPPPPPAVVDVERTVARLNELMSGTRRSLRFQVAQDGGRTVITVINPQTKEVVRQIPAEELLAVAHAFEELGTLIDARA